MLQWEANVFFFIVEQLRLGLIPVEGSAIAPVRLNPKNHFPNLSRQSFSLWKIPSLRGSSRSLIVASSSNTLEIHLHQSYSSLAPEHIFCHFYQFIWLWNTSSTTTTTTTTTQPLLFPRFPHCIHCGQGNGISMLQRLLTRISGQAKGQCFVPKMVK